MRLQAFAFQRLEQGNYNLVSTDDKSIKKQLTNQKNNKYLDKKYVYTNKKNRIVSSESGSIIVMDIDNGEILCSVSTPSFNPNIFSNGLDIEEWNKLRNNKKSPLLNRSMSGL